MSRCSVHQLRKLFNVSSYFYNVENVVGLSQLFSSVCTQQSFMFLKNLFQIFRIRAGILISERLWGLKQSLFKDKVEKKILYESLQLSSTLLQLTSALLGCKICDAFFSRIYFMSRTDNFCNFKINKFLQILLIFIQPFIQK